MPSRRRVLRTGAAGALSVATSLAGCLGGDGKPPSDSTTPDGSAPPDGTAEPESPTPRSQFQYDAGHHGRVEATVPENSTDAWEHRLDPTDGGLAVADGRVVVATGGSLVGIDADSGDQQWSCDVGHDTHAPPVLTDDTAYVTAWNGGESVDRGVVAVDLADGTERWRAIPSLDVSAAPTLADGTLYVGSALGNEFVVAIDATEGTELWRASVGTHAPTPAVGGDTVFAAGGTEHTVYAFEADGGEELWHSDVDDRVWGAPTVHDGVVYVGTRAGTLYALAPENGDEQWRVSLGNDFRASLAVTDDAIVVPDDGAIREVSHDGEERWSVDVNTYAHAPTVTEESVVLTDAREAVCLDRDGGTERWRFAVPDRPIDDAVYGGINVPPVVHDGRVYVASHGGDVFALASA